MKFKPQAMIMMYKMYFYLCFPLFLYKHVMQIKHVRYMQRVCYIMKFLVTASDVCPPFLVGTLFFRCIIMYCLHLSQNPRIPNVFIFVFAAFDHVVVGAFVTAAVGRPPNMAQLLNRMGPNYSVNIAVVFYLSSQR